MNAQGVGWQSNASAKYIDCLWFATNYAVTLCRQGTKRPVAATLAAQQFGVKKEDVETALTNRLQRGNRRA